MQESINLIDASAPQTTFIQNAPMWIYTDPNRYFREWNILPKNIGDNLYDVNNRLMRNIPENQEEGKLKRCIIDLGRQFTYSCSDTLDKQLLQHDAFSTLQGMLTVERISPGMTYSYGTTYESAKCRWYPIGIYNEDPNEDAELANQHPATDCPIKTGHIECNAQTFVHHNFLDEPLPLIIKIQDFHGPSGHIHITGQIMCIYTSTMKFRTNPSLGFYQLSLRDRAKQLTNVDPWKRAAAPKTRHVWVNPRLVTIKGIGIGYNMTDEKLTHKNYEEDRRPQDNTSSYSNILNESYRNLSTDYNFYAGSQKVPNNTNAIPETTILTKTNTQTTVRQIPKRKGTSPTPTEKRAKKLRVDRGTIIDQNNNKDLPVKITATKNQTWRVTTINPNISTVEPRQDTAATQVASQNPYQDLTQPFTDG